MTAVTGQVAGGTAGAAAARHRLIALIVTAATIVLAWQVSAWTRDTQLITPVPPVLRWLSIAGGLVLGTALGIEVSRAGRGADARRRFHPAVLAAALATVLALFAASLAERVANAWLFRDAAITVTTARMPIMAISNGGGGSSIVSVHESSESFEVSRADEALLAGAARGGGERYCLPLRFEQAGDAIRLRLPRRPRPTRTRRVVTIVRCDSGLPPARDLT